MNNIKIRGREYSVSSRVRDGVKGTELVYLVEGKRGASYFTMRNVHKKHLMFLMSSRNMSPVMDGVWLSDESGELVVVQD